MNKYMFENKKYKSSYEESLWDAAVQFFDKDLKNAVSLNELCVYEPKGMDYEKDKKLHVLINFSGTKMKEDKLYSKLVQLQPLGEVLIDWTPINREKHGTNTEYLAYLDELEEKHKAREKKYSEEDIHLTQKDKDNIKKNKENLNAYNLREKMNYNMDKIIDAIEEEKFPIMNEADKIDYIVNPLNLNVFRGYDQIGLQTNNVLNNLSCPSYMPLGDFYKKGGILNMKFKQASQIVTKGRDKDGNYVFDVVVPCKVSRREKKAEKEREKEELRRNIFDAKYVSRFGYLPNYETQLANVINTQQPLKTTQSIRELDPWFCNRVDKRLATDLANYFVCMFTKEKYKPKTNWKNPIWKEALKQYAREKPEEIIRMADFSYDTVVDNVLKIFRENEKNKEKENEELLKNSKEKEKENVVSDSKEEAKENKNESANEKGMEKERPNENENEKDDSNEMSM